MIRTLLCFIIMGFLSGAAHAQDVFQIREDAFTEITHRMKRVAEGQPTIWCADTKWADRTLPFRLTTASHFYGDDVERQVEKKFYFALRQDDGDLSFRKVKYFRPRPYSSVSLSTMANWQLDFLLQRRRASQRRGAAGFTIQAITEADAWAELTDVVRSRGLLTVAAGEAPGSFFSTASGMVVDLKWNRALADNVIRAPSPAGQMAFFQALGTLIDETDLSDPLCARGSVFVIGSEDAPTKDPDGIFVLIRAANIDRRIAQYREGAIEAFLRKLDDVGIDASLDTGFVVDEAGEGSD